MNITLLGTSHIARESLAKVKEIIKKLNPDIIALELDNTRLKAILTGKKKTLPAIKKFGLKVFLFNLIGAFIEKSLSKHTGIHPGSEMKVAIKIAKKQNIKIFLIDQPIDITIKKLLSTISKKEKYQLIKDIIQGLFFKKKIPFDLNRIPPRATIEKLLEETKEKYPNIYNILVTERNKYMSKALYKLMHEFQNKKILAIVGAGHVKGILGELKLMQN